MMSAPSAANMHACDRPWPLATPLMSATLPSTLPMVPFLSSKFHGGLPWRSAVADRLRLEVLFESLATVLAAVAAGLVSAVRRIRTVKLGHR